MGNWNYFVRMRRLTDYIMYGVSVCFHSSVHDFETIKTCLSLNVRQEFLRQTSGDEETEIVVQMTLVEPYQSKPLTRGTTPLPLQEEIDRQS